MSTVVQIIDAFSPAYGGTAAAGTVPVSLNVTSGNVLDVLFMAHAALPHTCVISKLSGTATIGTPVQIDYIDDTANYAEIYRFIVPITGTGSLTLQATYGKTNEDIMLAAAEISGAITTGYVTSHNTASPPPYIDGGSMSSGYITPSNTSGILCGWAAMVNGGTLISPTAGGGATLFASGLFSGYNSGLSYESKAISSTSQTEIIFLPGQGYQRTHVFGAFFSGQAVATITNVDTDNIITSTQTGVVITGGLLTGGTVDIIQGGRTIPQTVTATTDSTITFNVVFDAPSSYDLYYGSATLRVTAASTTDTKAITITPPDARSWVTIGTPNTTSSSRITSTPDLASGDIVEVVSVTGGAITDVLLNNDGTFDASSSVTQFTCRVWSATDFTWGSAAAQILSGVGVTKNAINTVMQRPIISGRKYSEATAKRWQLWYVDSINYTTQSSDIYTTQLATNDVVVLYPFNSNNSDQGRAFADAIKAKNPNVKILVYFLISEEQINSTSGPNAQIMRDIMSGTGANFPWIETSLGNGVAASYSSAPVGFTKSGGTAGNPGGSSTPGVCRLWDYRKSVFQTAYKAGVDALFSSSYYSYDGLFIDNCTTALGVHSTAGWTSAGSTNQSGLQAALQTIVTDIRNAHPTKIIVGNTSQSYNDLNGTLLEGDALDQTTINNRLSELTVTSGRIQPYYPMFSCPNSTKTTYEQTAISLGAYLMQEYVAP